MPVRFVLLLFVGMLLLGSATAARAADMNRYVVRATDELARSFARGGYDLGSSFTHDIPYGGGMVKKSSPRTAPAPSMCVAGVTEIMLAAINLYAAATGDRSPYTKAPLPLWTRGNLLSLRANLFMFQGTGSRGTANTLARFGMGRELPFAELTAGDFINLNRTTRSGHAVVFLNYLDATGASVPFGPAVRGFHYFSLQGRGRPDAGFGHRYAFFEGSCPTLGPDKVRDCHVIRSSNPVLLNMGRMSAPAEWRVDQSIAALRTQASRDLGLGRPGVTRAVVDQELDRELPPQIDPTLDGVSGE